MRAAILGLPGPALDPETRAPLAQHPPAGVILFARNIETPDQLRRLTADLRAALPPGAVIAVDQEGGRVARLRPPHFTAHPAASRIGAVFARNQHAGRRAAFLHGMLIGAECAALGFDMVCAPVLDRAVPGATTAIGDRAFDADPETVALLSRAMAEGLAAGGVIPVMKHLPGHGRALADSHLALPELADIDEADLLAFQRNADLPCAMTAHLLYRAVDQDNPATLSARLIAEVIRGRIGFGGLLLSDDLAMHALQGAPEHRAQACLRAGCDIALYCPGEVAQNRSVLEHCPPLSVTAEARLHQARDFVAARAVPCDIAAASAERASLLA